MKFSLVAALTLASLTIVGCAANPMLQAQVDNLQRDNLRKDAEIKDLSASAAKCNTGLVATDLKTDAMDLASSAWTWVSREASDGATYTKQIASCYHAGSSNVHSFEDSKSLMGRCVSQQH